MDGKRKIMLGEDDITMRRMLHMLLEIDGFEVDDIPHQKPVDEIVRYVAEQMPDILLLDVHINELNGIDLLRSLRADPALQATRIVMTSGMELKEQCMAAGASAFLLKPAMPDEMLRLIRGA